MRTTRGLASLTLFFLGVASGPIAWAGPTVVPTAEGQIGETPGLDDQVLGSNFESLRGGPGDVILGGPFIPGGPLPMPPEFRFLTDLIHGQPNPVQVGATVAAFNNVDKLAPASAWSRNAANDGDYVAFSFAVDGAMPETLTVRIATFDETGSSLINVPVVSDIPTFPFPDPSAAETGVTVDSQGRVTVAYTELVGGVTSQVRAQRLDGVTGVLLGGPIDISDAGHASTDIALLDPAGGRLIIPSSDFASIRGNILDTTGPMPVVLAEFPISTTPAVFAHFNPSVGANPNTGSFTVAWEDLTAVAGNPVDIRARRFDADGDPIGGEVRVNTTTAGFQDRPAVRFLPETDSQGRPQVAVVWRDVGAADGSMPNGTGNSYKCFSIEGLGVPPPVFEDGFESGDTSSWSETVP